MAAKTARRSSGRRSGKSKKPGPTGPTLRVVRPGDGGEDPEVLALMDRWYRLLSERQNPEGCDIQVQRQDNWFILEGWVDSFGTKGLLFSLVPEFEGARWIVDRVRVGQPAQADRF